MAELFESYHTDFSQLLRKAEERISKDVNNLSASARRSALHETESELEEAQDLLVQMEIEIQSFPQSVRDRYTSQLGSSRHEIEALSRKLRAAQRPGGDHHGLSADHYTDQDDVEGAGASQRQRLLQGTSVLEQGTERLNASTRLAMETEDIGANILQDLRSQREQIEHSRDTLHGANTHIDRSSRTLQQMIRRARQQKLVTGAIIVVLVLLILLILYSKLF